MKPELKKFQEGPLWEEPPCEWFTQSTAGARVTGEMRRGVGWKKRQGPHWGIPGEPHEGVETGPVLQPCISRPDFSRGPGTPCLSPLVDGPKHPFSSKNTVRTHFKRHLFKRQSYFLCLLKNYTNLLKCTSYFGGYTRGPLLL